MLCSRLTRNMALPVDWFTTACNGTLIHAATSAARWWLIVVRSAVRYAVALARTRLQWVGHKHGARQRHQRQMPPRQRGSVLLAFIGYVGAGCHGCGLLIV